MKRLSLFRYLLNSLCLVSLVVVSCLGGVAEAQEIPGDVINALFYPTSSQRFFQVGHEQFEVEVERLQNDAEVSVPLLEINLDEQPQSGLREENSLDLQGVNLDAKNGSLALYRLVVLPVWKLN